MDKNKKIAVGVSVAAAGFGLFMLAKASKGHEPPPPPPPGKGNLYGTVKNSKSGAPIAGVFIELDGMSTQTDSTGYYEFIDQEIGSYNISFSKEGYESIT